MAENQSEREAIRTVDGDHVDSIDVQVPNGKRPSKRSNSRILALEHTVLSKGSLLLSSGLRLDEGDLLLDLGLGHTGLDLCLEQLVLVLEPLGNLLSSESELSGSVLDVKEGSGRGGRDFSGGGENSSTRTEIKRQTVSNGGLDGNEVRAINLRRNGSSSLVSVGRGVGDDTLDRSTHLESRLGAHDNLDTSSLRLHETISGRGGRSRELSRLSTVLVLGLGVGSSLHVGAEEDEGC